MTPATALERFGPPRPLPKLRKAAPVTQLDTELFCAVLALAASRRDLERGEDLRSDFAENCARLYQWWCKNMHAAGSASFRTSRRQQAIGFGYAPERASSGAQTLRRHERLMYEVGLVHVAAETDPSGRFRCLRVTLLEPDPALVAQAERDLGRVKLSRSSHKATRTARRLVWAHETPAERVERRWCPYHRKAGRGAAPRRFSLVSGELSPTSLRGLPPTAKLCGGKTPRGRDASGRARGPEPGGHARGSVAKASGAGGSGRRRGDERPGVPEYRPLVRMLEQGFMDRLADVPGIELEPLRDTRRLEYALARLDRYLPQPAGGAASPESGPAAGMAMRIIDAVARDVRHGGSAFHPTAQPWHGPPPRHLGVIWQELHRAGFAARRARRERDDKNAPSGPPPAPPGPPVTRTGGSRC